jgi:TRAP-type C4-dicarboxylate transport system permease small subunit
MMVCLAFLQVMLRTLFDHGILWGDIFLRHLVLWVGFIGASLATRQEKHITIDLFGRMVTGRWKNMILVLTNLFSAGICLLLADAGWNFVMEERVAGTIVFSEIPAWYFQIIIPIGFLMMAIRFFILGLTYFLHLIKKG